MAARPGLNDLPEELLIAIFGYLSTEDLVLNIRKTCWRFSRLSRVPGLWRNLTIDDQQSRHNVAMLVGQKCVLGSPCDGRDITVAVEDVVTSVQERGSVLPCCSVAGSMFYPKLESISLTRTGIIPMDFLSKYHALRHLYVKVTSRDPQLVGKEYLAGAFRVLKNLTQLKTLTFLLGASGRKYSADASTQGAMRDYFMSGPKLKQLTLGVTVKKDTFKAVVDHCTDLQELIVFKCDPGVKSRAFATLSKRSSLYNLQLPNCPGLDDECLKSLAVIFSNLRNMGLLLTSKTSDEALAFLFQANPGLHTLQLIAPCPKNDKSTENGDESAASAGNALTGRCLRQFARRESKGKLLRLHLLNFKSLDGHSFRALCENQPNLRAVLLFKSEVSEDDVLFMVKHCQRLKSVSIEKCPQVGSRVAGSVMALPRLTFAACPAVGRVEDLLPSTKRTRSGMVTSPANRDSILESLIFNPCSNVTPRGLSAMLLLCPNLVRVVIHADISVDDDCVRTILRNCGRLQIMRIFRTAERGICPNEPLTDASLRHIQRMGAHLQAVDLPFTPSFSCTALARTLAQYDRGMTFILRRCPTYLNHFENGFTLCYGQQVARRQKQQGKEVGQKKRRTRCRVSHKDSVMMFCVEEY